MYHFWLDIFQTESQGSCQKNKFRKHIISFLIVSVFLLVILTIYLIWKYVQEKQKGHLFWRRSTPTLLPYPNRVSA